MQKIAVIGAGQMGAGIAQVSAQAGLQVYLSDISIELAEKGKSGIARMLAKAVEKEKIAQPDADKALSLIKPVGDYGAFGDCDLVIEAATEREDIKAKIFSEAAKVLSPTAVLGSNTSSISITRMARVSSDPTRFIGMHFFNPVPLCRCWKSSGGSPPRTRRQTSHEILVQRLARKRFSPTIRRGSSSIAFCCR